VSQDLPSTDNRSLRPPPWEERHRFGLLNALVLTIRLVLLSPARLFSRMPVGLGILQPLLFAVLLALVGAMFDWMWTLSAGNLPGFLHPDATRVVRGPFGGIQFLLSPIFVVALVFIRAGVFHAILVLLGGNRLGFEATFRVVAYSRATRLLSVIPFCGGFLGLVWELAVTIIGLARIHDCKEWQAVVAVVVPVLFALVAWGSWVAVILGLAALH